MCRLYVKFIHKVRVLCKTRLIFPRINGPDVGDIRKRAGKWALSASFARATSNVALVLMLNILL